MDVGSSNCNPELLCGQDMLIFFSSNSYMLGKSLWKMYNHPGKASEVGLHGMLDAFTKAIENVPERRDSRHPEKEPILEPHYKLVSVVHKLVQKKHIMVIILLSLVLKL